LVGHAPLIVAVNACRALLTEGTPCRGALGHDGDRELVVGTLHVTDVQTGEMGEEAGKQHGTLLVEQNNTGSSALLFYQVTVGGGVG
jgi:hypothetical protein